MNLNNYKTVFFIGIGGMGMRALAAILLDKGFAVKGSDKNNSDFLKDIASKGQKFSLDIKLNMCMGLTALSFQLQLLRIILNWSKQRGSGSRCSIDRMYLHLF